MSSYARPLMYILQRSHYNAQERKKAVRRHRRAIAANLAIVVFLIAYTLFGGFVFLHFESAYQQFQRHNESHTRRICVESLLNGYGNRPATFESNNVLAAQISTQCFRQDVDPKHTWTYKTAALYGFGILTTLGYGKIEPKTTNGRIFAVIYGFIGIPATVILLTNLGRYLERMALNIRFLCSNKKRRDEELDDNMSATTLFFIVIAYLILGAAFIPLMNGQLDFFNGIYFAFICLTAIEYGDLVPHNDWFVPIVIVYVCIGLALSTIALDIGSLYVRKLHYLGKKLKNIAGIRIWFGAKDLNVAELISAVGQNIGIDQAILADIDLEHLVKTAIEVKSGRLARVPQTHMIVEGIWPPELVPLFIKDGAFPLFVDSEDTREKNVPRKKSTVRFKDEDEIKSIGDRIFGAKPDDAPTRDAPPPPEEEEESEEEVVPEEEKVDKEEPQTEEEDDDLPPVPTSVPPLNMQ